MSPPTSDRNRRLQRRWQVGHPLARHHQRQYCDLGNERHNGLEPQHGGRRKCRHQLQIGTGDFNGDGKWDILWRDTTSGNIAIWEMNGTTVLNPNTAGVGNVATNFRSEPATSTAMASGTSSGATPPAAILRSGK